MKAAVVELFGQSPRHKEVPSPEPAEGEVLVTVHAAALSQLVRSQASGKHYTSGAGTNFVPGADGVGRLDDGRRVYFAFPRAPHGSMAEKSVVSTSLCIDVPDNVDDVTAAAIANPGMSSWAALTERAGFEPGQTVLVNGATGSSGRLAVQIAKHLGAGRVIATGRNERSVARLPELGADVVIPLDLEPAALGAAFGEELSKGVDVVLDYLWGESAERLITACTNRGDRIVRFVQIGSLAGGEIRLSSHALRSSGLELVGSGFGSVSKTRLVRAIQEMLKAVVPARLTVDAEPVPLAEVEEAWDRSGAARVVFTM